MSNLNLSGFSYPLYGNQYYKSISAHGTKSAFEPGSIDASKLAKCKTLEECLSVNIDLSKHYVNASDCYNNSYLNGGAGAKNEYIKLTPLPVLDPHSMVTVVTYDGNNSIADKDFKVEVGVLYGCDPALLLDPVACTGAPAFEYVSLGGDFLPVDAGEKQVVGQPPNPPSMNVGEVQIISDGASVLPSCYTGGKLGTPVLRILTPQQPGLFAGNVKVQLKWISAN